MSGIIKKWAVISAAWFVFLTIGTFLYVHHTSDDSFSAQNQVASSSDYVYITDNGEKEGIIYQMDGNDIVSYFRTGKLSYLANYQTSQVAVYEENPYAVFSQTKDDNGKDVTKYAVVAFNTDMEPYAISAPFQFDISLNITGFSVEEDRLYITGITENKEMVYVYSISTSQLSEITNTAASSEDVSDWESSSLDVTEVTTQSSEGYRYFANAKYEAGSLFTRMDNELSGDFAVDSSIVSNFNSKKMSPALQLLKAGVAPSVILIMLVCGVLVIFILCLILHQKKRITYMIAIAETGLLIGLGALYLLYISDEVGAIENSYAKWASQVTYSVFDGYELTDLSDTSIYSTSDYGVITERLGRTVGTDFSDLYLTKSIDIVSSDGTVVMSSDGANFDSIYEKYGNDASSLISSAVSNASVLTESGKYNGKAACYVAVPLSKIGLNGYGALIVASQDNSSLYQGSSHLAMMVLMAILFVVASAIIVVLIVGQNRDLAILQETLGSLSRGETDIEKPVVIGKDMNYIWNSVFEIQKNILHIGREKWLTYETYYRFAPKGIEKILDLADVTEIKGNEYVRRKGTLATISSAGDLSMLERDREEFSLLYEDLEKCRDEYNAIFVSHTNNFDLMNYLFLENEYDTTEFAIEYIQKIRQMPKQFDRQASILLDYASFSYGIVGTKEQASIYMTSENAKFKEQLVAWFRTLRLSLVVTENVLDHEQPDASLRHIGFISLKHNGEDQDVKLYEVLDALPATSRMLREETATNFAEGLRLFYERDFYFARNIFSDILRKSPDDEISKWYLFECEKYLDEAVPEDYTGALHME